MYIEFLTLSMFVMNFREEDIGVRCFLKRPEVYSTVYEVVDKQLFFLGVIKYGFEYRKVVKIDGSYRTIMYTV